MTESPPKKTLRERFVAEVVDTARFLVVAVPAYLALTTVAFAAYSIPSESMVPTIEVNDRVIVSKFAYGYSRYSLPLDMGRFLRPGTSRLMGRMPHRGDVVVFMHPKENKVMIKRLIGLPGDTIAVRRGVLVVNGEAAQRTDGREIVRIAHSAGLESAVRYREQLPGGAVHAIDEFTDSGSFDDFGPVTVPPNCFFAMGDNRDNSLDSRWDGMGPVPMDNLIGKAETVFFAMPRFGSTPGVEPPAPRLFRPLTQR